MNRIDAEFKKLWAAICCINKDCCLEEITYANLLAKVNSNTVEQKFYKITDRGDTGLILFGTDENHISLSGWGGFLNPDYQCQGDYSGVEALTGVPLTNTCQGVWYTLFEASYSTGDIVIWNGIHYQIIDWDAVDGNSPDINSTAYQILPKTLPGMGYIEEWDDIQFDIVNDYLCYRSDKRGNKVYDSWYYGNGSLNYFQWGNNAVMSNIVYGIYNCINNKGSIYGNLLSDVGVNVATYNSNFGNIGNSTFSEQVQVTANKDQGANLQYCKFSGTIACSVQSTIDESGMRCEPGFSNFSAHITLLNDSTIDTGAGNNYCGVFIMDNNNIVIGINVVSIINFPTNHPFTIYPDGTFNGGGPLLITGTPTAGIGANQISLDTASISLNAGLSTTDWVTFEVDKANTPYSQLVNYKIYA